VRVTGQHVIEHVTRYYKIPMDVFLSRDRAHKIAHPRQVAMYLMYRHCGHLSYPAMGRMLNRDHTTVIKGIRSLESRMADRPFLRITVEHLSHMVLNAYLEPIKAHRHLYRDTERRTEHQIAAL